MERTEPFILEYGKTQKKTATTDSSERKKETRMSSVSSEEFIGPKINEKKSRNFLMSPASNGSSLMYRSSYQNKEPSYKEDAGKYPEFSWQPAGQTNVINHQGGLSNQIGWEHEGNWNVERDDFSKSYIKYGDDADNANIQIRKYAQETDQPDEFKIKLNIRGNTTYKPGVDIVFLLDNSQSMISNSDIRPGDANRKDNANAAFEKIVDELKKINEPTAENIRIGAEIFSDYSRYQS